MGQENPERDVRDSLILILNRIDPTSCIPIDQPTKYRGSGPLRLSRGLQLFTPSPNLPFKNNL
jgi:hypothetical protein